MNILVSSGLVLYTCLAHDKVGSSWEFTLMEISEYCQRGKSKLEPTKRAGERKKHANYLCEKKVVKTVSSKLSIKRNL